MSTQSRITTLRTLQLRSGARTRRARVWSLLLALMMLALLPFGWSNELDRDRIVEPDPGSETELPGAKQPPVEQRSIPIPRPRPAAPATAPRLGSRVAIAPRRAAPPRRESPYLPHPSRFSERRLI